MFLNPLNYSEEKNQLFGLLSARLVYGDKEAPQRAQVPEGEAPKTNLDIALGDFESTKKNLEEYKERLRDAIKSYNKTTDKDYDKVKEPYKEPLNIDLNNPRAMVRQIDHILTAPYKYLDNTYTLLVPDADGSTGSHAERLIAIRNMITTESINLFGGDKLFLDKKWLEEKWNAHFKNPEYQLELGNIPNEGFSDSGCFTFAEDAHCYG